MLVGTLIGLGLGALVLGLIHSCAMLGTVTSRLVHVRVIEAGACTVCASSLEHPRLSRALFIGALALYARWTCGIEAFAVAMVGEIRQRTPFVFRCGGHTCTCHPSVQGGSRFYAVTRRDFVRTNDNDRTLP